VLGEFRNAKKPGTSNMVAGLRLSIEEKYVLAGYAVVGAQ
jgi:hypothetical protein